MSVEENKAVVLQYVEGMNRGDMSVIDELFTSNFIMHRPSSDINVNLETFIRENINAHLSIPDQSRTIDDIIGEGDKVSIRETIKGTQTGKYGNINATGKVTTVTRFIIFRLEDNKIAELWYLRDFLSFYQQLGILPPTEEIGK